MSQFVDVLVANISPQFALPGLSADRERDLLEWVLRKLEPLIPDSIKPYIIEASDGISDEEALRWENDLTRELNARIDIPWVPEVVEEQLIRPIVKQVIDRAKTHINLAQ